VDGALTECRPSGSDQLDVAARGSGELREVFVIDRHDLVPVGGKQHDSRVDDVGEPGGSEELPGWAAEGLVEGADIDRRECL
jgi:hypothetical protein